MAKRCPECKGVGKPGGCRKCGRRKPVPTETQEKGNTTDG